MFVESPHSEYWLGLGTVLQGDAHAPLGDSHPVADTFSIRKARLVLGGRATDYFEYHFVPDFAGGNAVVLDANLDLRLSSSFRIRIGRDKTPIGYELLVGDTSLLFLERSLASTLVPNRDTGVQAQGEIAKGRVRYSAGVFDAGDAAGRIAFDAFHGLGFHVGGSAGTHERVTPAVFYYHGPVGVFAEYVRSTGSAWNVTGSYVLTGEATAERGIHPVRAWRSTQLVVRYAELRLAGDEERQFTAGVNWYPATILKYYVNVERTTSGARPADDMLLVRAQLAF